MGKTTLVQQVTDELRLPVRYVSADEPTLRGIDWIGQQWEAARLDVTGKAGFISFARASGTGQLFVGVHVLTTVTNDGKLGSGAAEVGETAYGLRPITAGNGLRSLMTWTARR